MNQSQKPIRNTTLGTRIKRKAPHILDTVGDLLPDRGGLGALKWLLEKSEVVMAQQHKIWSPFNPHLSLLEC